MTSRAILSSGRVAVITGAAAGIGAAAARFFAEKGMRLALFDKDGPALDRLTAQLDTDVRSLAGDVTSTDDIRRLCDLTYTAFGDCALLFNNAGIMPKTDPLDAYDSWEAIMAVNLAAIVNIQRTFLPRMLAQGQPAAIVNLGSKEGITTPPGNVAYSVSKAGVKILTEHLEHYLRNQEGSQVSAHLFVPGYTWTPMNFPNADFSKPETKPAEPWSPEELMDFFAQAFERGDFYIIARDNEVTKEMDDRRMRWAMDDLIYNRPALSRWHPDFQDSFAYWLSRGSLPEEE